MINNLFNCNFDDIFNEIKKYRYFYISGHINPDGDSVGSQECLSLALKALGKDKEVVTLSVSKCHKDLIERWQNLPGTCFIQVDVQPEYRLPKEALKIKKNSDFSICFDHHQKEEPNCNLVYVDSSAAANALIIWEFVNFLDIKITREMATAAYSGLSSDTNSFMNTNTDKRTFVAATDMMSYGVDASAVAQKLFQSRSLESFELEQIALNNLYVDKDNRFAFTYLTSQDYMKYNATKADSDAMIDLLRQLECVDVACLIRQEKDGEKIHGSLRSKSNVDVSKLAKQHIGGGHKAAAGFTMNEYDIQAAIPVIIKQLEDLMQSKI